MILGVLRFLLTFIIISFCFSLHSKPIEARLAEIQILDKITAKVQTYEILNNKNLRVGSLNIEVFACFTTPPEEIPEDYVLIRIYDEMNTEDDQLIYQGWMISSSPASTPLEHPIYDLWLKDCKMDTDF
jgi:hypothetical protein